MRLHNFRRYLLPEALSRFQRVWIAADFNDWYQVVHLTIKFWLRDSLSDLISIPKVARQADAGAVSTGVHRL